MHQLRDGPENDERAAIRALADAGCKPRVLHRRYEGERRLRTLVEICAGWLQAVKSPAGVRVPHEDTAVISTEEPIRGGRNSVPPLLAAVNTESADTRIRQSCRLNRLLIESRALVLPAASSDWGHGKMSAMCLTSQ